jgi:hypothetical protein
MLDGGGMRPKINAKKLKSLIAKPLTITTQSGQKLTMSIDNFSDKILKPEIARFAKGIDEWAWIE